MPDVRASWSAPLLAASLALAPFVLAQLSSGPERSAEAERGRTIYTTGRSPRSLPLEAEIVGGQRVPAFAFPCVQCHLPDGSGAAEGGRTIPPLTRAALARPGPRRSDGEMRPAYDQHDLGRAIRGGLDPAGRALDLAMPRYEMDERDLADLLAYLDVLGEEPAPGCDERRVRIGTLLPLSGPRAAHGRALVRVLEGAFASWNEAGGIHGRRLELVATDAGDSLEAARAAARGLTDEAGGVLCLVAPGDLGAHPELLAELDAEGVPVVGPLAVAPDAPEPGGVFFHLASLADQARAAARFVAGAGAGARVGCIDDGAGDAAEMARVFGAELVALGIEPVAGAIAELAGERPEWLACFGERGRIEHALAELRRSDWRPRLLFASVLLGGAPEFDGSRFDLVAPAVGPGWSAGGERFEALRQRLAPAMEGAEEELAWQAAYGAVELLVQGLRASGREPSRERLRAELASVRRLETGVLPPLTFGPALRAGTHASLIVSHDEHGALLSVELVEPAPAAHVVEVTR